MYYLSKRTIKIYDRSRQKNISVSHMSNSKQSSLVGHCEQVTTSMVSNMYCLCVVLIINSKILHMSYGNQLLIQPTRMQNYIASNISNFIELWCNVWKKRGQDRPVHESCRTLAYSFHWQFFPTAYFEFL